MLTSYNTMVANISNAIQIEIARISYSSPLNSEPIFRIFIATVLNYSFQMDESGVIG